MNKERILELADFIESKAHAWDMSDCHTCFVGNFAAMAGRSDLSIEEGLGLGEEVATILIIPPNWRHSKAKYSRRNAVAALRKLAKTGKVVWPKDTARVQS